MKIRKTLPTDLPAVMDMYDYARSFMQANGNATQWIDGYPSAGLISLEIDEGHSFVCENEEGEMVGTFCFMEGPDPNYSHIYDGEWLDHEPYWVIHRMATNGKQKGIAATCFEWCFGQHKNIRVDTHRDNIVMQNILKKYDFILCGIIYVKNGTPRLAYQKK